MMWNKRGMERDHDRKHARNHDSVVCHENEKWI